MYTKLFSVKAHHLENVMQRIAILAACMLAMCWHSISAISAQQQQQDQNENQNQQLSKEDEAHLVAFAMAWGLVLKRNTWADQRALQLLLEVKTMKMRGQTIPTDTILLHSQILERYADVLAQIGAAL